MLALGFVIAPLLIIITIIIDAHIIENYGVLNGIRFRLMRTVLSVFAPGVALAFYWLFIFRYDYYAPVRIFELSAFALLAIASGAYPISRKVLFQRIISILLRFVAFLWFFWVAANFVL